MTHDHLKELFNNSLNQNYSSQGDKLEEEQTVKFKKTSVDESDLKLSELYNRVNRVGKEFNKEVIKKLSNSKKPSRSVSRN